MSENSKTSALALWVSVGIAVFLPQVILIAKNWNAFADVLPGFGALLLQVATLAGAVAITAAIVAAIAIGFRRVVPGGKA